VKCNKISTALLQKEGTSKRDVKEIIFLIQAVLRNMDITEGDNFLSVSDQKFLSSYILDGYFFWGVL